MRVLLESTVKLLDGQKPLEFLMPTLAPILEMAKEKLDNNVVTDLLKQYEII